MARQTVTTQEPRQPWEEPTLNLMAECFPDAPAAFHELMGSALMGAKLLGIPNMTVINGILTAYTVGLPEFS